MHKSAHTDFPKLTKDQPSNKTSSCPSLFAKVAKHTLCTRTRGLLACQQFQRGCFVFATSTKHVSGRGVWEAQSVEHLTSAQVMISQFVSSRPASGSLLSAGSLEPASDSVSLSLPLLSLSLSLSKINKH